ncbi:MAG: hypothetical protein JWR36_272 [Glaciihabitans sp.]|jgi:cbb3-type cytochrome oxidase subunit 3|nr:hypothetical protein [Glaciihabitans sp.]MDQ1571166.1 hypothetical protein [Actinomycetota bacterium]
MFLLASVLTVTEATHPLLLPNYGFAAVAFIIFLFLGIVTWSYRDVANRHANKAAAKARNDHSHDADH